jgi:hypothetical protein
VVVNKDMPKYSFGKEKREGLGPKGIKYNPGPGQYYMGMGEILGFLNYLMFGYF